MLERARTGIYPSCAPVGYRNTDGPDGKRMIVPDAATAPVITDLLKRFGTGRYSLDALVAELRAECTTLRGRKLYKSGVHQILRKRLYTGDFDWDGTTYAGTHEPTGNRGRCPEPYTRQEMLNKQFADILQGLVIRQPVLDWLADAVLESDRTEQAAREQVIQRSRAKYDQLNARIETMYLDKLEGRITQEFFDKQAAAWRGEQEKILRQIHEVETTRPAPVEQAIDMMRLTSRAAELFLQQTAAEQRRLLRVVVKNATWQAGELRTTLFEPFDILRHSNRETYRKESQKNGSGQDFEIWLLR